MNAKPGQDLKHCGETQEQDRSPQRCPRETEADERIEVPWFAASSQEGRGGSAVEQALVPDPPTAKVGLRPNSCEALGQLLNLSELRLPNLQKRNVAPHLQD